MQPPRLDKRTRAEVLRQALILAGREPVTGWTGYTPDWTLPPDESDPGHRVLESFARLAELLIGRLNQMPERNFLSFLDLAGVERFPGAPAEVPVTFTVSKRAPLGGIVPAGTPVATTQTRTSDARVFETRRPFFASRAALASIVALEPAADRYATIPVPPVPATTTSLAAATPITALSAAEPSLLDVDHVLYLASEPLFARKDGADVALTLAVAAGTFPDGVAWSRFDKDASAWVPFAPQPAIDRTTPGQVTLTFSAPGPVGKVEVDGVEDFWVAGAFIGDFATLAPPIISGITGRPVLPVGAAVLDAAFYNGAPLDVTRPFLPFGPRPAYGDAFYFGSLVGFAPENASVTLQFTIRPYIHSVLASQFAGLSSAMTVRTIARWQYLDAAGEWIDLRTYDHQFNFSAATPAAVTRQSNPAGTTDGGEGTFVGSADGDTDTLVDFSLFPSDIGLQEINGIQSHWLRVLLFTENPYGTDGVLVGAGTTTPRFVGPLFIPPRIDGVTVTFAPRGAAIPVERVKTLNNFEWRDQTASGVIPFSRLAARATAGQPLFGTAAALYIGFDRPLEADAFISLFVDLAGPVSSLTSPLESGQPAIAWEYWRDGGGWAPLDVRDDTLNLTTSGTAAFAAPRDAAAITLFAQPAIPAAPDPAPRWWIRARLASGSFDYPPRVRGIYLNTVMAENRATVAELLIGSSSGEPDQILPLVKGPVLAGDVWVRESERPTAAELYQLDAEHAADRGEPAPPASAESPNVRDATGSESGVWVRWRRVPNFRLSGPRSRHYALDSVAAIVGFGNGTRGHIPEPARNNLVLRDLEVGGGANANREVGALAVKELKTSLPFIDKVFNVQPAAGGASAWTLAQFEDFGPQSLKNRGRAVTTEDYEWMIRQQFSDVARTRCIPASQPGPGGTLQFKAGAVTALVVPWSADPRPQPNQGLLRKVREFLAGTVLGNITADVHVKGPDYVAIDVEASLVPTRPEFALVVARKAQEAIDAFLHPLTGGENHAGYGFGRPVYLSELQAVLERVAEVDHVISARFSAPGSDDVFEIAEHRLASSGTHSITVVS